MLFWNCMPFCMRMGCTCPFMLAMLGTPLNIMPLYCN